MTFLSTIRVWGKTIKLDVVALWIAARDPRVPFSAKVVAAAVAAYALSPIDLIPDFIPVLGYLDDLVIVPFGIMLAVWLVPPQLMAEFREEASKTVDKPKNYWGITAIALIWLVVAMWVIWMVWPALR